MHGPTLARTPREIKRRPRFASLLRLALDDQLKFLRGEAATPGIRRLRLPSSKPHAAVHAYYRPAVRLLSRLAAAPARLLSYWLADDSVVIIWLSALLFLGAAALTAWIVISDYDETRASAEASIVNLTNVLEEDIARNVEVYDLAIQETAAAISLPGITEISPELRRAALFSRVATTEFLSSIHVLDASGDLRYDSSDPAPKDVNVADREYFRVPRDHPEIGLYIDAPIRSRFTGKDVVVFSRRITGENGSFAGIVTGSVETDYFSSLFASLRLGPGGAVTLVRTDGIVLARYPDRPGNVGSSLAAAEPFQAMLQQEAGVVDGLSTVDHIQRTYAYRHIGALPLIVSVSYGRSTVFAAWKRQTILTVASIAALIGLGAILIVALRRQLAQRGVAERQALQSAELARRSEGNLAVAFNRIDAVFRYSADAQYAASRRSDGKFVFDLLNRRCEDLTGLHADDVIGKTPGECLPPDVAVTILENWEHCVAKGEPLSYEHTRTLPIGPRHWETLLVPVRDVDGEIYRLIGTIRDVTDRKQIEEELLRRNLTLERRAADATAAQDDALARASAAERLQILGQLATGVAHDFNNVLQSVSGCAAIIERRADEPTTMRHAARLIADAAARGSSITQRLLAFSRKDPDRPERITIPSMLADVADILRHTLRGTGHIDICTEVADDSLAVHAVLNQLKTVLLNLATNARDAMPEGGRLLLAAAADTVQPGHPTLAAGDYVRLWVQDDGSGMDEPTIARATEPFFTTKPVGQGTGLGLSMARTYAEESGGALSIESRPGLGTTVTLWLRP